MGANFHSPPPTSMPVSLIDLEAALRNGIPVTHLEVVDESSGCGEKYSVFVVSDVRRLYWL